MKKTINVNISETAEAWLRTLVVELGLPMGIVVERALLSFDGSGAAAVDQDRFASFEARLAALETRLDRALKPCAWDPDEDPGPTSAEARSDQRDRILSRDEAITELWGYGNSYKQIQEKLFKMGITAVGRDGEPKPISLSIISRVAKDL